MRVAVINCRRDPSWSEAALMRAATWYRTLVPTRLAAQFLPRDKKANFPPRLFFSSSSSTKRICVQHSRSQLCYGWELGSSTIYGAILFFTCMALNGVLSTGPRLMFCARLPSGLELPPGELGLRAWRRTASYFMSLCRLAIGYWG